MLSHIMRYGRAVAYLKHHWQHESVSQPGRRKTRVQAMLWAWRVTHPRLVAQREGVAWGEANRLFDIAFLEQSIIEQKLPRNYHPLALQRQVAIM